MKLPSFASGASGLLAVAALAVLLVPLGVGFAGDPQLQRFARLEDERPAAKESPVGTAPLPATSGSAVKKVEVEKLSCFGCHNIERYRQGKDLEAEDNFSHDQHRKVGHCHLCHAFDAHAAAPIREDACAGCH